jgi:hypothetical protein
MGLMRPSDWRYEAAVINQLDMREKADNIWGQLLPILTMLTAPADIIYDIGEVTKNDLLRAGWEEKFVMMPGFGYARPHYECGGVPREVLETGGMRTISPWHDWSKRIAITMMDIDLPRFSMALLPTGTTADGVDVRQRPFGRGLAGVDQISALHSLTTLYAVQGALWLLRCNRSWVASCYDIARLTGEMACTYLEPYMDELMYLYSLPLHPMLAFIADSIQDMEVETAQGLKPAVPRVGLLPTNLPIVRRSADYSQDVLSSMMRSLLLNEASSAAGQKFWAPDTEESLWVEGDSMTPAIGVKYLHAAIKSLGSITERWAGIAAQLGWTNSLRAKIPTIRAHSANFMLTDGVGYSDEPAAGVLGLRPVLSMGNIQVDSVSGVRFDSDFNASRPIMYSPMVVKGYQGDSSVGENSTLTPGSALERVFILAGMHMGEPDATRVAVFANDFSPMIRCVQEYYATRFPGGRVVRENYMRTKPKEGQPGPAQATEGSATFVQTDWDATAIGPSRSEANAIFFANVGAENTVDLATATYLNRDMWYHRFPVRMAIANEVDWFNEYGIFVSSQPFRGVVLYEDTVNLSHTTGILETVVDYAQTRTATGPSEPVASSEQIQITPGTELSGA